MPLDCPGWHTSTTLMEVGDSVLCLLNCRGGHPLRTTIPLEVVHTLWSPFSQIPNVHLKFHMRGRCEPTSNSDIAQWSQWWTRHSFSLAFQLAGQSSRHFPKPRCLVSIAACVQSNSSAFDFSAVLLLLSNSTQPKSLFPQVWTVDWKSWVENFRWTLFNLTGTHWFREKSNYMYQVSFFFCLFFFRPSVCCKNDLSSLFFFAFITSCILFSTNQMYRIK